VSPSRLWFWELPQCTSLISTLSVISAWMLASCGLLSNESPCAAFSGSSESHFFFSLSLDLSVKMSERGKREAFSVLVMLSCRAVGVLRGIPP
jgi:hypothetical protein